MALHHNPRIITNGLIFAIDPADQNCYPGSGTAVKDLTGNHPGGVLSGGTLFEQDRFFRFDGSDDSLQFATDDVFERGTDPFTIEAWVRLLDNTGTSDISAVVGGGNPLCDGCDGGYFIYFMGTSSTVINLRFDNTGVGNMDSISYTRSTSFEDNKFYHIVGLRDGVSTRLYLDGVEVATGTDNAVNVNDISTLYISGWSNYRGNMDVPATRIYNRALSPEEVIQNYEATKTRYK